MPARHSRLTGMLLSLSAALALACFGCAGPSGRNDVASDGAADSAESRPSNDAGCGRARSAMLGRPAERAGDRGERGTQAAADTDVLHYKLDIEVFPATKRIAGVNTMTVKSLMDGLSEFTFRLHADLAITAALLDETTPVTIKNVSTTTRRAVLKRAYDAGDVFTLTITYEGSPPPTGFASSPFQRRHGVDVISSFSCPFYAHTWWPCKDGDVGEPGDNSDKATVELAVTAPDHLRTVSNGVLRGVDTLPESRKRYRWATDYPIATYLVAFSSTNYVTWTAEYDYGTGTMPVEFNVYPERDSPKTRRQLEQSLVMLETFGQLFGPYPFINEKYGIYQFEFGGGMEHQTNTGQGSFEPWLTAHELSHQWWGDAVTCRTWHDTWLNEGFATYSEALWREFRPDSSGKRALHRWMAKRRPYRVDDSVYVYDTSDWQRIFSSDFSYRKGAWVLHQLRHIVGDEAFFQILAKYRATYEGGAATTNDFAAIASTVHGRDLDWFFDQWVYGPGAPAYEYGWQGEQIDGQHYLRLRVSQVQNPDWGVFVMPLDVQVDYEGGSETCVVFNDARAEHFVIPIPGAATAVGLDRSNWVLHTSVEETDYIGGPPVVVRVSPSPGGTIPPASAPARVTITFSADVSCSASDFAVEKGKAGPVPFTLTYSSVNCGAMLDFGEPLPPGDYTVTVSDSIRSADGIPLDGELMAFSREESRAESNGPRVGGRYATSEAGVDAALDYHRIPQSLPSGDGLPGGKCELTFIARR